MCGIAGYFYTSSARQDLTRALRRMTDAIVHRGPDDVGYFESRSSDGRALVGLGHRRLSIIDLSTGHQPLGNADGSVQIVFNGEIYNFEALRAELSARGYPFFTRSDTETIVHAYEEWGVDCVSRLRGMFAFAIWDARCGRLFLARDRFGKKPLFIHARNGLLLFASEIKALLQFPGVTPRVDQAALSDYFRYRYVPGPATLFAGVRKLSPGSWMLCETNGTTTQSRYYVPPDGSKLDVAIRWSDPVGKFLEVLEESVRIRMISDVPFGAFLSGGIDSSAVVGLMARYSRLPVKTFSVGFTEAAYSELPHARAIAELFQTEHHELVVSQEHLLEHLPALTRFRDAPVAEPSDIPIYLLASEARRTVKMVLTGEGSDELLGGYPKHVYERYVPLYQQLPGWVRHGLIEPVVHALPYRFRRAKTAVANLGIQSRAQRMPRWFGALADDDRAGLLAHPSQALDASQSIPLDVAQGDSALRAILFFDQTSWLPDNLLERGDRMTMGASIEARMPFLDHELAALVSGLPDTWRVRGFMTKRILRLAMRRLLPARILRRPKVGFRVPVNEWFRSSMRDYLFAHLTGTDSRTRDYYRPEQLRCVLQEHVEGRHNHEKLLWCLLNLEIWQREFKL
jgi:asparagine synthase (glutamine-hydrolysing)